MNGFFYFYFYFIYLFIFCFCCVKKIVIFYILLNKDIILIEIFFHHFTKIIILYTLKCLIGDKDIVMTCIVKVPAMIQQIQQVVKSSIPTKITIENFQK